MDVFNKTLAPRPSMDFAMGMGFPPSLIKRATLASAFNYALLMG